MIAIENHEPQMILLCTANGILQLTEEIAQNSSTRNYSIQENYLQVLIENSQLEDVKAVFDEMEKRSRPLYSDQIVTSCFYIKIQSCCTP
jgi:F0F1-type ATP synthase delta subunit